MEHLEWLVASRSENQRSTVALYLAIAKHKRFISGSIEYQSAAEELAAVAFSLWRAVFLSDLVQGGNERLAHLDMFLESLIADNTVVYATDKRSREWTFQYYVSNARFRLQDLARSAPGGLVDGNMVQPTYSEKEQWTSLQRVLSEAIGRFDDALQRRAERDA